MTSLKDRITIVREILYRSIYLELGQDLAYGFDFELLAEEIVCELEEMNK